MTKDNNEMVKVDGVKIINVDNLNVNARMFLSIGTIFDNLMDLDWDFLSFHHWRYNYADGANIDLEADFDAEQMILTGKDGERYEFEMLDDDLVEQVMELVKQLTKQ